MEFHRSSNNNKNDALRSVTVYLVILLLIVKHMGYTTSIKQAACTATAPLEYRKTENASYIIGGLFPVHYFNKEKQSYDYHSTGLMWIESMLFAIDEINAQTDLLPNVTLGYRIFDTCGGIGNALEATLQLITGGGLPATDAHKNSHMACKCTPPVNKIIGLVGDAPSSVTAKVAALLSVSRTPQISYSSTSTDLSKKNLFPSFMRTLPPDNFQAVVMADLMLHFKWKYINIVACDNLYGRVGVDELLPQLKSHNICVAVLNVLDVKNDDGEGIKRTVRKLKQEQQATVIVLWCQLHDALRVLKTAEHEKLYHRTWIATESYGSSSKVYDIDRKVITGMFGIIPAQVSYQPFAESLKSITPNNSDGQNPWLEEYWVKEKKCIKIINTTGTVEPQSSTKYKCPDKNPDLTNLPTKKYINVFDAVYAIAHGLHNYLKEKPQLQENGRNKINTSVLNNYVRKVNFTGKNGGAMVSFNEQGDPAEARYSITNVQYNSTTKSLTHVKIGGWNFRTRKISLHKNHQLRFSNDSTKTSRSSCTEFCTPGFYELRFGDKPCCWKCVTCPDGEIQPESGKIQCIKCGEHKIANQKQTTCIEPKMVYLAVSSATGFLVLSLMVASYLLIVVCVAIFFVKQNTPIVKASNKGLSCLQIVSMLFQLAIPCFHFQKEVSTGLCGAELFSFVFFTTITISVIFTKADRLLRVFKASKKCEFAKHSRIKGNSLQYFVVFILTIVGLAISALLFVVLEPRATRVIMHSGDRVTIENYCGGSYDTILFSMVAYNVTISLVCGIYAFKERKLPQDYNEARFTSFAIFTFVLLWVMAVPIYFSETRTVKKSASWCILCILSTVVIFVPMYVPKVYVILFRPEDNTAQRFRENLKVTLSDY